MLALWRPEQLHRTLSAAYGRGLEGCAAAVQVDGLLMGAHKRYSNSAEQLQTSVNNQKKYHEKNLEHYNTAREAYLKRIEETVEFLKKEGISGAAKLAADTVAARVEDAKQLPAYLDKEAKVSGAAPLLPLLPLASAYTVGGWLFVAEGAAGARG